MLTIRWRYFMKTYTVALEDVLAHGDAKPSADILMILTFDINSYRSMIFQYIPR